MIDYFVNRGFHRLHGEGRQDGVENKPSPKGLFLGY